MSYTDKEINMLKKSYDEKQIGIKKDNFNFSKTTSDLDSRINELESSLAVALEEIDYLKNGRKNLLSKEEVTSIMRMIPPTTQRSVNIPVTIDQGGTGVTTLAEAQALFGGSTVDLTADVTGTLPIANGGTGEVSRQAALDALADATTGTNEHALIKDTATGNIMLKAQTGGLFTDSGTTAYLTTTTDDLVVGATSPVSSAKLSVDGDADQIQCVIQGHSTQTSNIFVVEKSDGTDLLAVSNTGGLTIGGTTNEIGSSTSSVPLSFTTAWCDKVPTLTDGATPALDASLGNIFTLSAAGDRTIAVPTNPTSGQKIIIRHYASGGARTLALNTGAGGFRFGSDIPALSQTASGKYDYIGCVYNSTASFWDVISYVKGF
jgi:hypothetical protein